MDLSPQCQERQRIWGHVLKLLHLFKKQIVRFYPRPTESVFLRLEAGNLVLIDTSNFS